MLFPFQLFSLSFQLPFPFFLFGIVVHRWYAFARILWIAPTETTIERLLLRRTDVDSMRFSFWTLPGKKTDRQETAATRAWPHLCLLLKKKKERKKKEEREKRKEQKEWEPRVQMCSTMDVKSWTTENSVEYRALRISLISAGDSNGNFTRHDKKKKMRQHSFAILMIENWLQDIRRLFLTVLKFLRLKRRNNIDFFVIITEEKIRFKI